MKTKEDLKNKNSIMKAVNKMMELKELYTELSQSRYDAFQYRFDSNCQEFKIAFEEGIIWMELGFKLEKSDIYNRQAYVALGYASELFLKSILNKCNIKFDNTHELFELFKLLDKDKQKQIKNFIKIEKLDIIDSKNKVVKRLNIFEDFLKYISMIFVDLRYDFEKVYSSKITTIPIKFINDFVFTLYVMFERKIYNKI